MKDEIKKKVSLLETENKRLKGEVKRLTTWVEVLTQTKQNLQLKIQVLNTHHDHSIYLETDLS